MPRKPPPEPPAPVDPANSESVVDDGAIMVAALTDGDVGPEPLPTGDVLEDPPLAPETPSDSVSSEERLADKPGPARAAPRSVSEIHLKGILESLIFVSDKPITASELAKVARADLRDVKRLLDEVREEYRPRGVQLDEIAGGWQFRSAAANAPFVRELLQARPVRLTRAQVETLAIIAYRQPITRPEVDDIRGVDSGSAVKVLLERDLIRILGRKEDVGRPVLYGTSGAFLEFFGLKSLRDLPTLREFTELTPESEATLVRELGDEQTEATGDAPVDPAGPASAAGEGSARVEPPEPAAPVESVEPVEPGPADVATDAESKLAPPS